MKTKGKTMYRVEGYENHKGIANSWTPFESTITNDYEKACADYKRFKRMHDAEVRLVMMIGHKSKVIEATEEE